MLRPTLLFVALIACLASCGGKPVATSSTRVATVAGETVTLSDLHSYLRYASRYYASTTGTTSGWDCTTSGTSACHQMKQQVLRRLIELAVVTAYADHHGIRLDQRDEAAVVASLDQLGRGGTTAAPVYQTRTLLKQEVLVRKVEDAVVGRRVRRGPSVHLVLYLVPNVGLGSRRAALDLATFGTSSLVPGTARRVEWIATFRLSQRMRLAALTARPGDFIGPYRRNGYYLVARLLDTGDHPYGKPARTAMETRLFKEWLAQQLRREHPVCFGPNNSRQACPAGTD